MTSDRFPLITEEGHRLLRQLEEHPHAPRYTHPGYNRLTAEGLRRAKAFAAELRASPPLWRHGEVPESRSSPPGDLREGEEAEGAAPRDEPPQRVRREEDQGVPPLRTLAARVSAGS